MDDKSFNIRVPKRWARVALIVLVTALIVAPLTAIAAHTFTDVPDSNTFHDDIAWLEASGVTKGCNPPANTEFCPDDSVTRGQMSAFMRRFAQYIGAEDGTPALADSATNADNADQLDGKSPAYYEGSLAVRAHGFFTDPLGALAIGTYTLAEVDISVPDAGSVLLQGNASWETLGNDSNIVQWLEWDTGTPCDTFADGDPLTGSFAEVWVDGNDSFDSGTTPSMTAVDVSSSGNHTAYLCATVQSGTINSIDRVVAAQWSPNADVTATGGAAGTSDVPDIGVAGG